MTGGTNDIFRQVFLGILIFIVVSLPLSLSGMTIGSLMLLALWLWSDFQISVAVRFFKQKGIFRGLFIFVNYLWTLAKESIIEKTGIFLRNRAAVIFASIFVLGLAGMIFTGNFPVATASLRIKLPLLLFPLVFPAMKPLNKSDFRKLMLFYVAAIAVGTLIGSFKMISGNYSDVRQFSPFISPVRFGLNITFGILCLGYFIIKDRYFSGKQKVFLSLLITWFVWFLIKMESVTSLGILILISLGILVYTGFQTKKSWAKISLIAVIFLVPASIYFYLKKEIYRTTHVPATALKNLTGHTAQGHIYILDTTHFGIENGRYVGAFLCIPELKKAWNKRGTIPFDSLDKNGNPLETTLIRYMTSKGIHKDSAGVAQLSNKDIENIENGIANINYVKHPGLFSRLLMIEKGWEVYKKTGKVEGSSVFQRYEFIKAAIRVIRNNFWTGVGTGDLIGSLCEQYRLSHSGMDKYCGFIAHNEYLDVFAAFGVFGFLYFLFALVYPPLKTHSFKDYFFVVFYAIMLLSMLSDDTMETHAGITLFAFFLSLLMFGKEKSVKSLLSGKEN